MKRSILSKDLVGTDLANTTDATGAPFYGLGSAHVAFQAVTLGRPGLGHTLTTVGGVASAAMAGDGAADGLIPVVTAVIGGPEVRVNSYLPNDQYAPAVASLSRSGYVVVWSSDSKNGSGSDIYAQRYSSNGAALGEETRVNSFTDFDQAQAAVVGLSDGGYVVTWQSLYEDGSEDGVYAQRYDANGNALSGPQRVNNTTVHAQASPAAAALSGGGYVITWQATGQDGSGWGVFARRYDVNGVAIAAEDRVNTTTAGDQYQTTVAGLASGGYVVTWASANQDHAGLGVYVRRYDSSGNPLSDEVLVNTTTAGHQQNPCIAALKGGGFVIVWEDNGLDGSESGIFLQRYDEGGNRVGATEQPVNTYTNDHQLNSAITALADGGYVISWSSRGEDGSEYGVFGRRYDADGKAVDAPFQINTTWNDYQNGSALAGLADGGYVATWHSAGQNGPGYDVYQKLFAPSNQAPVLSGTQAHLWNGREDVAYRLSLDSLLAGFSDPDGHTLAVTGLTADQGIIAADPINSRRYIYTPPSHFSGTVTFSYVIEDGFGGRVAATQTLGVVARDRSIAATVHDGLAGASGLAAVAGGYVVISDRADLPGLAVQRFDTEGREVGGELAIRFPAEGSLSAISETQSGGYITVFTAANSSFPHYGNIFAQVADRDGNFQVRFSINSDRTGDHILPVICRLVDGTFLVAWCDFRSYVLDITSGSADIYARRLDSSGQPVGQDFAIAATAQTEGFGSGSRGISLAALPDGGYAVGWIVGDDAETAQLVVQAYSAAGTTVGQRVLVALDVFPDAFYTGIQLTTVDATTVAFTVEDKIALADTTTGLVSYVDPRAGAGLPGTSMQAGVQALSDGRLMALWINVNSDGTEGISAVVIDKAGHAVSNFVTVATHSVGNNSLSSAVLENGDVALSWIGGSETAIIDFNYYEPLLTGPRATLADQPGDARFFIAEATLLEGYTDGDGDAMSVTDLTVDHGSVQRTLGGLVVIIPEQGYLGPLSLGYTVTDNHGGRLVHESRSLGILAILQPGSEQQLGGSATGLGNSTALAANHAGGYLAAWTEDTGGTRDVRVQFNTIHDSVNVPGAATIANTQPAGEQGDARVVALSDNRFVVVWTSAAEDTSGLGVYGRVYAVDGTPGGVPFQVNTYVVGDQGRPDVGALAGGGFVVVWTSVQDGSGSGIYAQRFDADGQADGNFIRVNVEHHDNQLAPAVVGLRDGSFIVTWSSQGEIWSDHTGIVARHFDAEGRPMGDHDIFISRSRAIDHKEPAIAAMDDGGYIITWLDQGDDGWSINGQRYYADGRLSGQEFQVVKPDFGTLIEPAVVGLADGGYVVTWSAYAVFGTSYHVWLQRYDSQGAVVGAPERVNSFTTDVTSRTSVTALDNGGFIVSWARDGANASGLGVYEKIYAPLNHRPVQSGTLADLGHCLEDAVKIVAAADLLAGFSDVDGDSLTVTNLTADHGTVTDNHDGTFGISPDANYNGPIVLSYVVSDGLDGETLASNSFIVDAVADDIYGTAGDDQLNGGLGGNYLHGLQGNDTYFIDGLNDQVFENPGEGSDSVSASVGYTLGLNLENLTLTGNQAVNGTGNNLDNIIGGNGAGNILTGLEGNDRLDGGAGDDTMAGGLGDDTFAVDSPGDVVNESNGQGNDTILSNVTYGLGSSYVEVLNLTGTANIDGTGNQLDNRLTGNAGYNRLDGSTGADTLAGGAGNDTYVVDNAGDVVVEANGEGVDTLQTVFTTTLSTNLENLVLTGTATLSGTGNGSDNTLLGNGGNNALTGLDGNDKLDGGLGADSLAGGLGNDTYVVDANGDVLTEGQSQGTDTVQSSVRFTLGNNVERLILIGTANIAGTGNGLNNVVTGNSGNNRIDGGAGADVMAGGAGDDAYVIDDAGDRVFENTNEGNDSVVAGFSYSLGSQYVENLTLTGTADLNATGNGLANTLIGNAGNNVLSGGTGADNMWGGAGNDTFYVDNVTDRTYEKTTAGTDAGGHDLVYAGVRVTLDQFVEDLVITGTASLAGTGNGLNNRLTGNGGNNVLSGKDGNDVIDGAGGADVMAGGLGDDSFYIDNSFDRVVELNGQGNDTVYSSVSFTFGNQYVETLLLTGNGAVNATGNGIANTLIGNAGNNRLDGGAGNDALTGGLGADVFVFGLNSGSDRVSDFNAAQGDTIDVHAYAHGGISGGGIVISQVGADTVIALGGGNVVTVVSALMADVAGHVVW